MDIFGRVTQWPECFLYTEEVGSSSLPSPTSDILMVALADRQCTWLWSRVRKDNAGSNPVGHPLDRQACSSAAERSPDKGEDGISEFPKPIGSCAELVRHPTDNRGAFTLYAGSSPVGPIDDTLNEAP